MRRVFTVLGRPFLVPVWILVAAALVLLPRLGAPGLWEPQELAAADDAARRADEAETPAAETPPPDSSGKKPERCPKEPPNRHGPRTLSERLAAAGLSPKPKNTDAAPSVREGEAGPPADAAESARRNPATNTADFDMRLRLALVGILCVVAAAGIALRLAGARAGLIAGLACLSFPLLVLQSRQLTSDIGTAAGGALLVYGCVALMRPARWPWLALDLLVSAAALAGGLWLGWNGGGALLGLIVPLGAVALAGGLGASLVLAVDRILSHDLFHVAARIRPRLAVGRRPPPTAGLSRDEILRGLVALAAAVVALYLAGVLAHQIYNLRPPVPGTREMLGKSILPSGCWSEYLGGMWKIDDDLRATYDSLFEQIAFGTFPAGILAPIAMIALALRPDPTQRLTGNLTIAWAGLAWIAAQVWHRKVGFCLWPGFPAAAVAIGVWLDAVFAARAEIERNGQAPERAVTARSLLIAVFVFLGVVTIAKDIVAFPDKLTSLLVADEAIKFPQPPKPLPHWLGIPLKSWVLLLGVAFAGAFSLGLAVWRPRRATAGQFPLWRWTGRGGLCVAVVLTFLLGLFWVNVWHWTLSRQMSSKQVFAVYRELRSSSELLGIMGDMGNAPRYYAGGSWQPLRGRDELLAFLARPERVFALAPGSELCAIHRQAAGNTPYIVLDNSNVRTLLFSNRGDRADDRNPLAQAVLRTEPAGVKSRPSKRVVWDNRIELVGWTLPSEVQRGDTFRAVLYFKVLDSVGGSWKVFSHFDLGSLRFNGDHDPIRGLCATSYWQRGDYIVDEYYVKAGDVTFPQRDYEIRVGFFTGSNPNWRNMTVSEAPDGIKDSVNRIFLGKIRLR